MNRPTDNLVCFAHGKESGPWGKKIQALAAVAKSCGYQVASPDFSFTFDPQERIHYLLQQNPNPRGKLVLCGSSMGGYVATHCAEPLRADGLFLLAPALYMSGYDEEPSCPGCPKAVVHGWNDKIIPVENAMRFAKTWKADLTVLNGGHTLTEHIPRLQSLFEQFLLQVGSRESIQTL